MSKLPERARLINQGDEANATMDAVPTTGWKDKLPKRNMTAKVRIPVMADAAREPNSLIPKTT